MKKTILSHHYNLILTQRNALFAIALGSLIVILLLAITVFYMVGRERIILVPPVMTNRFWVSSDDLSDSYLEQMSDFFVSLVLNVTPSSFEVRSQQLLQHVDPNSYAAVKTQMVEQEVEIKKRAMTTNFHATSFKIERKQLLVEVKGELRVIIGTAMLETKTKTYQIQFNHRQGRLYIKQFKEVPHG